MLFCYVNETGQDTQGRLFIVAVVVTESERDDLRQQCGAIELESGKGQRKWVKSKQARRLAYIRQVLDIPVLHGKLCFLASYDHVDYLGGMCSINRGEKEREGGRSLDGSGGIEYSPAPRRMMSDETRIGSH